MNILVTGGAGYIGSHTVKVLLEKGFRVVVLDSLVSGHREAVSSSVPFYHGDICDSQLVTRIVKDHAVDAVIHFAARSQIGESIAKPDLYFYENTAKSNQFLSTLIHNDVKKVVFSSTAAVYGIPKNIPITEQSITQPINPYGLSKLMIEQSMQWLEKAYGLRWMVLRYFNAAGAALDGSIGEDHHPETHLIPIALRTALGKQPALQIYGTDYDTPDGTCIRDYIHVLDLAEAHVLSLQAMAEGHPSSVYNVGVGRGYSVMQVIEAVRQITGCKIQVVESERRSGDPAELVAKVDAIREHFGWKPKHSNLETIIRSAWRWHQSRPDGYAGRVLERIEVLK